MVKRAVVTAVLMAALHLCVSPVLASVCGNALREPGEQCDDGNGTNLDGCSAVCKFEQIHRTNAMAFTFTTDAMCTVNAFGGAFVGTQARSSLNQSLTDGVNNGSVSIIFVMQDLDDLSGTTDPAVQVGLISGTPFTGTTPYNGANDLDWWYSADASTIDPNRVPLTNLAGSIAANLLTTDPASVVMTFPVLGVPATFTMSAFRSRTTAGSSSAPLIGSGYTPPGHSASERLASSLTSYQATSGGHACGNISAASLANFPIPAALAVGGLTACSQNYPATATMLDMLVGGCTVLFIPQIAPTQPDQSDPSMPVAGAGAPYTLTLDPTTKHVTVCRDKDNVVVDLDICLDAAAYSSAYNFTTDRVIVKPPMTVPAVVPNTLALDAAGNSVLEPGETATVVTSWLNPPNASPAYAMTSSATSSDLTVVSGNANYGTIADGSSNSCSDCLVVTAGASRPAKHWDTHITETPSLTPAEAVTAKEWTVHVGNSFSDVPTTGIFYRFIESLLHHGVTLGCSTTDPLYCPASTVLRDQMAAFIARSLAGSDGAVPTTGTVGGTAYDCAVDGTSLFEDVPAGGPFCRHVHLIAAQNVTGGCGIPNRFCPSDNTRRDQMAAFIARALVAPDGDAAVPSSYSNPATNRSYDCGDGLANAFTDVPDSQFFCKQIYYVWARGVLDGYPDGTYGPSLNITRDGMAKFLANAFSLTPYHP